MHDDAPAPSAGKEQDDAAARDAAPESFPGAVAGLLGELPGLFTDRVHLLALELRRASGALGQMVALGLLAAILFATAWLTLWGGLVAGMITLGLFWPWAVLVVLAVNLAAAAWALQRVKALAPFLALPATLRRLTTSHRADEDDDGQAAP